MTEFDRDCIAIVGPTGIGKSDLAMAVAVRFEGEIINADALQAYRRLTIGTSKPTAESRARVRHHLVDILDPAERFSAGEFARRATEAIEDIRGRGHVAVVVGGSGLYYRALFEGLSPIPEVPEEVRQGLQERLADEGVGVLYEELRAIDEPIALRLSPNDKQRITRALEVFEATGKTLSKWHEKKREKLSISVARVGLTLPRDVLYDRLERRARRMLRSGWLEEVRELLAAGVEDSVPAFQAIGYKELAACVRGERTLDEAATEIVLATRRYAKRQQTWFKNEPDVNWFEAIEEDKVTARVLEHLEALALPEKA